MVVRKYDAISEEADRHGVMMTPTVIVDGEVVASGKSLSANRLEQLLEQHLKDRGQGPGSRNKTRRPAHVHRLSQPAGGIIVAAAKP